MKAHLIDTHLWYQGQGHLQRSKSNIRVMFLNALGQAMFILCNPLREDGCALTPPPPPEALVYDTD